MTSTSWFKLFGIGACVALAAGACTVSSGEDDDEDITTGAGGSSGDGGSGGNGVTNTTNTTSTTGNTTSNTTSTTSGTSTTGGGGAPDDEELDCLSEANSDLGDVASCEFDDDVETDCCDRCIVTQCCEQYSACYASDPFNVCGGTEEGYMTDSEIFAFQKCMLNVDGGALAGTDEGSDFENCIEEVRANVSDPECSNDTISAPTSELAFCMAGGEEGIDGCFTECLDNTFDEVTDTCAY